MSEYCPYCGSGSIESYETFSDKDEDEEQHEYSYTCKFCGKGWRKLVTISIVLEE